MIAGAGGGRQIAVRLVESCAFPPISRWGCGMDGARRGCGGSGAIRKENAGPSTHHPQPSPQAEPHLGPLSLRMTVFFGGVREFLKSNRRSLGCARDDRVFVDYGGALRGRVWTRGRLLFLWFRGPFLPWRAKGGRNLRLSTSAWRRCPFCCRSWAGGWSGRGNR